MLVDYEYCLVIWSVWISVDSRITLLLLACVKGANIISVLKNFTSLFLPVSASNTLPFWVQKKSPCVLLFDRVHCACCCYFFANSSSAIPTEEKTLTVTPLQEPKQDSTRPNPFSLSDSPFTICLVSVYMLFQNICCLPVTHTFKSYCPGLLFM